MNKLSIGICDDEVIIIDMLQRIVSDCLYHKKIDYEIETFLSGEELLKRASVLNLVFLDIEMPDIDGIETGEKLRKINKDCLIVMATSRIERFKEGYKISAVRFVTKPFDISEIMEAIECILKLYVGMDTMRLYCGRVQYDIPQKDIKYMISVDSYVEFKVGNQLYRSETSLNSIEEAIDERLFFRVSKRYIINFMHVDQYKHGFLYIGMLKLTVSRRKKKEFEKAYMEYNINFN